MGGEHWYRCPIYDCALNSHILSALGTTHYNKRCCWPSPRTYLWTKIYSHNHNYLEGSLTMWPFSKTTSISESSWCVCSLSALHMHCMFQWRTCVPCLINLYRDYTPQTSDGSTILGVFIRKLKKQFLMPPKCQTRKLGPMMDDSLNRCLIFYPPKIEYIWDLDFPTFLRYLSFSLPPFMEPRSSFPGWKLCTKFTLSSVTTAQVEHCLPGRLEL